MLTTRSACWLLLAGLLTAQTRAADLSGTVFDAAGEPVAGARVDIASAAPKLGRGIFCPTCYVDCAKRTTTDERGQFQIAGLSDQLKFRVLCTAAGMHAHITDLVDPALQPLRVTLDAVPPDFPRDQTVRGMIVGEQGQPIEGALVSPHGAKTADRRWMGRVDGARPAVSDHRGRFVMYLAEELQAVDLEVEADGYAGTVVELVEAGGDERRIEVPVGAKVSGALTLAGAPAADVRIAVVQTDRSGDSHFIQAVAATSDSDGRFVIENLPAAQEYVVFSPVGDLRGGPILTTKRFRVPESGSSRDLGGLSLRYGLVLAGRIEPPVGQKLPPDVKMSLGRDPAWDLIEVDVADDGAFVTHGLPPETYAVRVVAQGWEIDPTRLRYQQLSDSSFGVRLEDSLDDLVIPVRPVVPKPRPGEEDLAADADKRVEASDAVATAADTPALEFETFEPLPVQRTAEPAPADGPKIRVAGRVTSTSGEPLADAAILLRAKLGGQQYVTGVLHNRDVLARTTTDEAGRFLLEDVPIPPRMEEVITDLGQGRPVAEILVAAEGFGLASADVAALEVQEAVEIRLAPAVEVRGVVRTPDGAGIPGAAVRVWAVTPARGTYDVSFRSPGDVHLGKSEFSLTAVTDAAGSFEMENVPRDRRLSVSVMAPGFTRSVFFVDTAEEPAATAMKAANSGREATPVLESPLDVVLEETHHARFTVIDSEGAPVRDGAIQLIDSERHFAGWDALDADGVAHLPISETGRYHFVYASDPLDPRIGYSGNVEIESLDAPAEVEVQLPRQRILTGRVVDSETGRGVIGAYLLFSQTIPEGESAEAALAPRASAFAVSGGDGEFRLPVVPGRGRISIPRPLYGYVPENYVNRQPAHVSSEDLQVEIPAEGEIPRVEVRVSRGLVIRGSVTRPDGEPLANARVVVQNTERPHRRGFGTTDAVGRFEIGGISPHAAALVTVRSPEAAVRQMIPGDPAHAWDVPRVIELELQADPGITLAGRVLQDGAPQPGVRMVRYRSLPDNERAMLAFSEALTDAEGRYAIAGLQSGDRYRFDLETADGSADPAWLHQMPYVQTVPENAAGVVELPDVNLVTRGQMVGGTVVDPAGNPVSGVTVSTKVQGGSFVGRGTETGEDGQFVLEDLPDLPLELMAYLRNPEGGRIMYPTTARPELHQLDVRIIFDPALHRDVENLDEP